MTEEDTPSQDKHRELPGDADTAASQERDTATGPVVEELDNLADKVRLGSIDDSGTAPLEQRVIDMADIEFVLKRELRPLLAELAGEVDRSKALMKRLGLAAAGTIALAGILLFVASGRLAGEIGNLDSATLAISKRIVNMNSALETFANIESKIRLVDQGQADILTKLSTFSEEFVLIDERVSNHLTTLGKQISSSAEDDTQFVNLQAEIGALESQLSEVQVKLNRMSQTIGDLDPIKESISILADIERQNLTELFAKKLVLEEAQLQKAAQDDPEPQYDPEIILLNPR